MPEERIPSLTLRGREYRLDPGKLGPADDRLCRDLTTPDRLSVLQVLQALLADPALDRLSIVLLFSRRQNGEPDLTLEEVEKGLTYADLFDAMSSIGEVTEVEEEDTPAGN